MKYATAYDDKSMARAMGVALPVSTKKTVEVCSFVKGRELSKAIRLLEGVIAEQVAVPFHKYAKGGTGHKPGIGPGRYPKNVCTEVIKLLRQVEANARNRGLNAAGLVVSSILAKKAAKAWHFGRQRRRQMKRTHIEVVVSEVAEAAKKASATPAVAKSPKQKVSKQASMAK